MAGKLSDNCPKWADEMLRNLLEIEQYLGNIPSLEGWKSNYLEELQLKAIDEKNSGFKEGDAEIIFTRVVKGLHNENFSVDEILAFINARVGYKDGPKYCTLLEVKEALGLS